MSQRKFLIEVLGLLGKLIQFIIVKENKSLVAQVIQEQDGVLQLLRVDFEGVEGGQGLRCAVWHVCKWIDGFMAFAWHF
jgi:hypothetical protein